MKSTALAALALRLIIGGILFYAGFVKAVAPAAEFAAVIEAYRLLPASFATPLAKGFPWLEMWLGTFLIFGYSTRVMAKLSAMLFAIFLVVLGSALLRHIDLASCGCFGPETLSPRQTILLDAGLLVLSLTLARLSRKNQPYSIDSLL